MRFIVAALFAAMAFAVFAAPCASAADLPVRAPIYKAPSVPPVQRPYDWSGFYLGGHLGYLWGRTHVEEGGVVTEEHAPTDGVIGGVLAGYNWQSGPLVFGIEADFGWTHARGEGSVVTTTVTTQAPNTYTVNWTGHARGRLGYAADAWLLYVAGGLGVADFDFREGAITTTVTTGAKYYGWSVGGGVEFALTRHLIGRVEYFYDDYGHKDYAWQTGDAYRVSLTGQTLRAALAWKFDPAGVTPSGK